MNRAVAVVCLVLALACPAYAVSAGRTTGPHHSSSSSSSTKVYVKGYYRKDGTYVPPHYRSPSGSGHSASATTPHATPHTTTTPRSPSASSSASPPAHGCQTCPRDAHGKIIRSQAAREQFMRQTGYPRGRPGYVVDHIVPLECGGEDTPGNMQWQTVAEAKAKDRTEGNCRR